MSIVYFTGEVPHAVIRMEHAPFSEDFMQNILIVEDNPRISELVASFLCKEGYSVEIASSAEDALSFDSSCFQLFIVDLMLPNMDGVDLTKKLKERVNTPILMLTAIDEELQEVHALDAGVDDYLAKPIQPQRLLSRVKALLRRNRDPIQLRKFLNVNEIRREVTLDDRIIQLTDAEFDLLNYLVKHKDKKIKRNDLVSALRGFEYDGLDRSIDMRVSALRKKIGDDTPPYKIIRTIRGYGYLFTLPEN